MNQETHQANLYAAGVARNIGETLQSRYQGTNLEVSFDNQTGRYAVSLDKAIAPNSEQTDLLISTFGNSHLTNQGLQFTHASSSNNFFLTTRYRLTVNPNEGEAVEIDVTLTPRFYDTLNMPHEVKYTLLVDDLADSLRAVGVDLPGLPAAVMRQLKGLYDTERKNPLDSMYHLIEKKDRFPKIISLIKKDDGQRTLNTPLVHQRFPERIPPNRNKRIPLLIHEGFFSRDDGSKEVPKKILGYGSEDDYPRNPQNAKGLIDMADTLEKMNLIYEVGSPSIAGPDHKRPVDFFGRDRLLEPLPREADGLKANLEELPAPSKRYIGLDILSAPLGQYKFFLTDLDETLEHPVGTEDPLVVLGRKPTSSFLRPMEIDPFAPSRGGNELLSTLRRLLANSNSVTPNKDGGEE